MDFSRGCFSPETTSLPGNIPPWQPPQWAGIENGISASAQEGQTPWEEETRGTSLNHVITEELYLRLLLRRCLQKPGIQFYFQKLIWASHTPINIMACDLNCLILLAFSRHRNEKKKSHNPTRKLSYFEGYLTNWFPKKEQVLSHITHHPHKCFSKWMQIGL